MNIEGRSGNTHYLKEKDAVGKITGFFLFRNLISSYNQDKIKHEEDRKRIKKYGIVSLILSTIALLISGCCIISNFMDFDFFGFSYVLIMIIYVVSGIILALILGIYGMVFGVMQVRLNRKSVGIFGIILSVLSICSSIFLGIFLFI